MDNQVFCNKCGSKQIAGSMFCNICGVKLPEISLDISGINKTNYPSNPEAPTSLNMPRKAMIRNLFFVAVLSIGLVIIGILLFNSLNGSAEPPAVAACIKTNTCEGYIDPETIEANNAEKAKKAELTTSWVPEGFTIFDDQIAYQWIEGGPDPCGGISCQFNTLNATSQFGCPDGIYVEVNFLSNGVVVDWSNDTVPSLAAGQIAQLQFVSYEGNADSAQVANMSCH